MLIEIGVADAYGAGFEYVQPHIVERHNTLECYVQHPTHHTLGPGMYTDDTQMSIALAEHIAEGAPWTKRDLAQRFVAVFKRDERDGYARGFQAFLESVADGEEFLARIRPDSDKSGAAMRAIPVGVFGTAGEVLDRCRLQASITHDTPDGIHAAQAAALMSHYFLQYGGPKADLGRYLEGLVPGQWNAEWQGKVGAKGWMSVRAAVTAVMRNGRLSDLLKDCVNFLGDSDTVAAIALGAASCSEEYTQDIPERLYRTLEDGAYGRRYLETLDKRLFS